MTIYVGAFAFVLILNIFFECSRKKRTREIIFSIACLSVWFISAFKNYNIADDIVRYCIHFREISELEWNRIALFPFEFGYVLLNKIISTFSQNNYFFLIITESLILIPIFLFIWKYSKMPLISLLIFMTFFWELSLYILRQGIAIAFLLWSCRYIINRKFFKFTLLVVCAALFHKTALVFFPMYFIYKLKIDYIALLLSIIANIIFVLKGPKIIDFLKQFSRLNYSNIHKGGINLYIFLWLTVLISFVIIKASQGHSDYDQLTFNMCLVASAIQPLSFSFSLFSRIVVYFTFGMILIFPSILYKLLYNKKNRKFIILIEGIFILVLFMKFKTQPFFNKPYYFMWE